MAAPMEDDEPVGSDDYYSLLNCPRTATQDELKAAYRKLCMVCHPDKHREDEDKQLAEKLFNQVHTAYEVLSDPQKRTIYDIYGKKGLEVEWDVVPRTRTPQEIREEYERLQKEREERRLQQRANPKGSISVKVDATDVFDQYDDYEEEERFPRVEISQMGISQSVEMPLTSKDTATLSGSLQSQNGMGGGTVNCSLRRITSDLGWAEFEVGAGEGLFLGLKGHRIISKGCWGQVSGILQSTPRGFRPGINTVVSRQLDKNTAGFLVWRWGLGSNVTSQIVRTTPTSSFQASAQLGIPTCFIFASYTYKLQDEDQTSCKVVAKAGTFGAMVEYGAEKKISTHSRLGAFVSVGVPTGVMVKVKLNRANQMYLFPIHLCHEIAPNAVFYGSLVPVLVYFAMKKLVMDPYLRRQKEEDLEKKKESSMKETLEKKREAESAVRLMQATVQRIVEAEEAKQGLVILSAWYGKLVASENGGAEPGKVIDVMVPLQCQVKDSKLILTETSKAGLPGFYDPAVGEDKSLRVVYKFHSVMHEVTVEDDEPLRIPKQSHKIPDPS
ncbi:DNAJC11 [Branchiostoma lanceolatum]|uniref:DnaJ homolog subfamily C member 11 n=1 Tax=Branchiostoma lanceolatum TaxID=7740 RepID=A0A8J9YRA1_BRALA|nr:DNAJC11 [Branchiostoma lanceolatum]